MIFLARAGRQFLALRGIRAAAHVGGQASAAGAVPGPIACRPGPRAWTAARWRRFRAVHEGGMGACRGAGHPASVRQQPFRLCLCAWKALLSTRRYFVSLASACVRAETVSQGSAASLWRSPAPVRGRNGPSGGHPPFGSFHFRAHTQAAQCARSEPGRYPPQGSGPCTGESPAGAFGPGAPQADLHVHGQGGWRYLRSDADPSRSPCLNPRLSPTSAS